MPEGLIETAANGNGNRPDDQRIYGVATGEVVENCDQTNLGRVRVRLPWLPGYEPWARVAAPMAGMKSGAYFMPQKGDEVLVAFNQGDVLEAFVIGSMWNGLNKAPIDASHDAESKWLLRTPGQHELLFDDDAKSIEVKSSTGQRIKLGSKTIEVMVDDNNTAAITMDTNGNITIKSTQKITLDAQNIVIKGAQSVGLETQSAGSINVKGGAQCTVDATSISIG